MRWIAIRGRARKADARQIVPMKALRDPRCLLVESRWLVPRHFDGISLGPIVLLRPDVSAGLIAHELVHVRQFWRRPFTHGPRYLLSKAYRQACEVEAYRAQLQAAGRTPSRIANLARYLATKYRLDLDEETAVRLLSVEDLPH
ncbi:hypothetical protein N6G02_23790 [Cupriavidus gilardii]|uniref:DUF4157 domain-containing protein n=2 Tax=Cupriavidus gilardii TaxID=82541 RepID=A0ABY4VQS3_9BURK|nr:hypothetical protein [Cupriavidus gilardii]MCT9119173.1 hypothetical protein [Cupriavidus gilardii]USE78642.1 hypothetical protein NDR89_18470 [Cupriavidus gilardii]